MNTSQGALGLLGRDASGFGFHFHRDGSRCQKRFSFFEMLLVGSQALWSSEREKFALESKVLNKKFEYN